MAKADAQTGAETAADVASAAGPACAPAAAAERLEGAAAFGHGFLYDLWRPVALSADLKRGRMGRREIMGEPVLLGRGADGRAFALRDICPHRAAPLSAGRLTRGEGGASEVRCPYHGWRFRTADGTCAAIPSLAGGPSCETARVGVRAYPLRESQGLVFVYLSADPRGAEAVGEPAVFPGVVGGAPKIVDRMIFDTHVDHAVVGLMDPAHGPYVHSQWWWRSTARQLDKAKAFEPRPLGFAMARHAPSRNSRAYAILGGAPQTEIVFQLPGLRWEHIVVGRRQVLALTILTPIDARRTEIVQLIWSDHPAFILLKPLIAAAARRFLRQDAAMVTLQNEGLRYDAPLLWIDDADRQAKWYQALKRAWIRSRRDGSPFRNPVEPTVLRWRS